MKTSSTATYISMAETDALRQTSLSAINARLAAVDMVTVIEAARMMNTGVDSICAWVAKGRCIGVPAADGLRLPKWQFEPIMWAVLLRLSKALGTVDGRALLLFLETPSGALDALSPRSAIERGQAERVLALARWAD